MEDEQSADERGTVRPELAELRERKALLGDAARPEAVAKRHESGRRTARENVADLVDPDSFVEYGGLAIAAQRARREVRELIERTPADGLIGGLARINGERFGDAAACAVLSYDYMVLAGTQGVFGHRKKDRLFELIERLRLPTVLFAEGGGGRPGDTDYPVVSALDTRAFALWARISGLAPRIAIVAGRCFAGNALLAGSSDLIVAAEDIALGMGGPAMVAGGGLGEFAPEEIGPIDVQSPNGVVDLRVADEAAAVAATKQLLAYFQGPIDGWEAPGPELARSAVPESRRRAYDVHAAIEAIVDVGSATWLRDEFARTMVTGMARIEGRPVGIVANNPMRMAGAITSDGADKAARFMQLCDAYRIPLVSLIDTPGMMVGPEAEATALVRHCARLFNTGANLRVPHVAVILRKAYGLGAQAMAGGGLHEPLLTVGWPTAELGAMGLEGAVRLGLRRELDAIADPDERERRVLEVTEHALEHAKALNAATIFELDDVIDPAETRRMIAAVLEASGGEAGHGGAHCPVDAW
ncbi:MAG TPA: carboxyl transferase domain-containing protein [Solirubrobacterales bacterium]|nr:carboxyl transferase domain-containing protein [Solirubrobacterales bacterium]